MRKNSKRILSVTIKRMIDPDHDTSCLGEYSNNKSSEYSIDRKHSLDCQVNEYRYFNPSFNYVDTQGKIIQNAAGGDTLTPEEVRQYVRQDYERMERLNAGDWYYLGIRAEAEIQLTGDLVQTISSGGLWGIESDSDASYIEDLEREQLSNLKSELRAIGFSTRAISKAFKNVERQGE